MLKNLNHIIYSILGSTTSYISLGSALSITVCIFDDITIKPCMYIQVGKIVIVNSKLRDEEKMMMILQ
jgi:hypothetical protein